MVAFAVSSEIYKKKQCYFKVIRAPVSPTLDIKTLKTVVFEVHNQAFNFCQLKSTFVFMANFITQPPASVTTSHRLTFDLVAAVEAQGWTCFYRLSSLFYSTTGHWGIFSLLKKNNVSPVVIFRILCNCNKRGCLHVYSSRVTGLSHISGLLKHSVTHWERMKTDYFVQRSFSNHTLSPC